MSSIKCFDTNNNAISTFYQWDINQTLKISGVTMPPTPLCHFVNKHSKEAIVVVPTISSSYVIVDVPNILLQEAETITIYFFGAMNGTDYRTRQEVHIPVQPRQRPSDYEYSDNIDYESLEQLEQRVNDLVFTYESGAEALSAVQTLQTNLATGLNTGNVTASSFNGGTVSASSVTASSFSGGTVSADSVTVDSGDTNIAEAKVKNDNYQLALHLAQSGNRGLWDYSYPIGDANGSWIICRNESNKRVVIEDTLGVNTIYTQGINPYAANDTLTLNNSDVDYAGHTSNGGKDLVFTVTYPHQNMKDITTLTVTACKLAVRHSGGYLAVNGTVTTWEGYDFKADSNASITAVKVDRYTFYVKITMNSKFTNLPNDNCNVSVSCCGLTVKFT